MPHDQQAIPIGDLKTVRPGYIAIRAEKAVPWVGRSVTVEAPEDSLCTFAGLRVAMPESEGGGYTTIPWTSIQAIRHRGPLKVDPAMTVRAAVDDGKRRA